MKRQLFAISAIIASTTVGAHAATLTLGSRVNVSQNNANFDISVFAGTAGYNDRGIGGSEPGSASFRNQFGDGTVLDYNFFHSPGDAIASYADGGAGRIAVDPVPAGNVNGAGENWSNVWTSSDPGAAIDFSGGAAKDFTGGGVNNTFARAAEVDGTIDISGLDSGQIYFPHGTFIQNWTLTATMSGPGQTDIVALDTQALNGPGRNFGWITDFSFDNSDGLYDSIAYNYTNADRDGSRARFMGVILDGAVAVVPEPSSTALLGLGGLALMLRRRR